MIDRLYIKKNLPFKLLNISILNSTEQQLEEISNDLGLALNKFEMRSVKEYFSNKGRNPTDIELQTIGQTWSEHCFHKTFKGDILNKNGDLIASNLFKSFISRSTENLNPSWCFSVFEDNAGIIRFDGDYGLAIKVETHNHPSAVEPFGGAATGIGGVIRDPLGVWAEPIACMDVLCFGPLDYDYNDLPEGVKHPRYLFNGVVSGIGFYGNNMGIPTVNGAICFDEGYVGNPLVFCGCVGVLPLKTYVKDPKPGDAILLVGGKTGRDGIHGVTFASLELTEESEASRPAVQIANPIEEEKLRRGIIEVRDKGLGSGITDLGGGGLSSAVCETANKFNGGAHVELTKIPLKTLNMAPWEIWISESQERMLLSVRKENVQKVLDIFHQEEVEATCIGYFTEENVIRLDYLGSTVAELDTNFLFQPPRLERVADWKIQDILEPTFNEPQDLTKILFRLLSSPNIASKEDVIRTYDHEVRGNTVLKPLQGRFGGPNDAAVIKPLNDSWRGVVISCGINPRYGKIDPYWMAASVIDEAIRNNVAVGGRRISLLDNFSWGNPEKEDRLGGLVRAVKACYDFSMVLETPFVSGKDSLYNESPLGPVNPTLLITGIGIVPDIRRIVTVDVKRQRNPIVLVGKTSLELGGSEYYNLMGYLGNSVPRVDALSLKQNVESITEVIDLGYVESCHDLSEGGLAVAAAEMSFSGGCGIEIDLRKVQKFGVERDDYVLFSESNSRFLLEVNDRHVDRFKEVMKGCTYSFIGKVRDNDDFLVYGLDGNTIMDCDISDLRKMWKVRLGDSYE